MRITTKEAKQALQATTQVQELATETLYDRSLQLSDDAKMIAQVREKINALSDVREDLVAELKGKIEKGEYNPTGEEIADAIIKREAADRIR
jgi:flagellar biosynthesis anti-sigma factor FlgM